VASGVRDHYALPMFGDCYTPTLVSLSPDTSMLGNQIYRRFHGGPQPDVGATLTVMLANSLSMMADYLYSVIKAQRVLQ